MVGGQGETPPEAVLLQLVEDVVICAPGHHPHRLRGRVGQEGGQLVVVGSRIGRVAPHPQGAHALRWQGALQVVADAVVVVVDLQQNRLAGPGVGQHVGGHPIPGRLGPVEVDRRHAVDQQDGQQQAASRLAQVTQAARREHGDGRRHQDRPARREEGPHQPDQADDGERQRHPGQQQEALPVRPPAQARRTLGAVGHGGQPQQHQADDQRPLLGEELVQRPAQRLVIDRCQNEQRVGRQHLIQEAGEEPGQEGHAGRRQGADGLPPLPPVQVQQGVQPLRHQQQPAQVKGIQVGDIGRDPGRPAPARRPGHPADVGQDADHQHQLVEGVVAHLLGHGNIGVGEGKEQRGQQRDLAAGQRRARRSHAPGQDVNQRHGQHAAQRGESAHGQQRVTGDGHPRAQGVVVQRRVHVVQRRAHRPQAGHHVVGVALVQPDALLGQMVEAGEGRQQQHGDQQRQALA